MFVDNLRANEANTNPNKTLPTSPINTFAFGKLKGKKPKEPTDKAALIKAILDFSSMQKENTAINPKPINPVKPAIPSIPSIKL